MCTHVSQTASVARTPLRRDLAAIWQTATLNAVLFYAALQPGQLKNKISTTDCIKLKYTGIAVRNVTLSHHYGITGTQMPYGITQYYLPPGRGDIIPAFTPAEAGTRFIATPEGCKAELT